MIAYNSKTKVMLQLEIGDEDIQVPTTKVWHLIAYSKFSGTAGPEYLTWAHSPDDYANNNRRMGIAVNPTVWDGTQLVYPPCAGQLDIWMEHPNMLRDAGSGCDVLIEEYNAL